jgi:hypothetical protein
MPAISKKAIPIIDPSNMTRVLIPSNQQSSRSYYYGTTGSEAFYNNIAVNDFSAHNTSVFIPPSGIYNLTAY